MSSSIIRFFLAFFLFSHGAQAAERSTWEQIPSNEFSLAAPPSKTASRAEIEILLQFQNERSKEQCAQGRKESTPSFKTFFADVSFLSEQQFELLTPFMTRVSHLGERVAGYFKSRFRRERPFNFDARIVPCIHPPAGAKSYPSSHASVATLDACVLSLLFPHWAAQYKDLGTEISERRLQVGVHFPSDVNAGQELATAICERIQQDPEFVRELAVLREQL